MACVSLLLKKFRKNVPNSNRTARNKRTGEKCTVPNKHRTEEKFGRKKRNLTCTIIRYPRVVRNGL